MLRAASGPHTAAKCCPASATPSRSDTMPSAQTTRHVPVHECAVLDLVPILSQHRPATHVLLQLLKHNCKYNVVLPHKQQSLPQMEHHPRQPTTPVTKNHSNVTPAAPHPLPPASVPAHSSTQSPGPPHSAAAPQAPHSHTQQTAPAAAVAAAAGPCSSSYSPSHVAAGQALQACYSQSKSPPLHY